MNTKQLIKDFVTGLFILALLGILHQVILLVISVLPPIVQVIGVIIIAYLLGRSFGEDFVFHSKNLFDKIKSKLSK